MTRPAEDPRAYLAVDGFLGTLIDARSLKTAFEIGLIDHLLQRGSSPLPGVQRATGSDARGLALLLNLLQANRVVQERLGDLSLHPDFAAVLRWRDLLETKLDFAGVLLNDFADHFTSLVRDPERFVREGRLFELFDYRRALQGGFENWRHTRAWMKLTSALTRYEARALLAELDLSGARRWLDVGGNSGEFMLQACRRHVELQATVLDLPLVCEIGLEHVLPHPESNRIAFLPVDLRHDALPAGHDLISFKSMLHDWPEADAAAFVERAASALAPGGTLLVFERGPLAAFAKTPPLSVLPVLLFFRSYREPALYADAARAAGLEDVQVRTIELDTSFFALTARKPAAVPERLQ